MMALYKFKDYKVSKVLVKKYIDMLVSQTSDFIFEASRSSYQTGLNPGSPSTVVKPEYNGQISKYISERSDTCTESLLNREYGPSV